MYKLTVTSQPFTLLFAAILAVQLFAPAVNPSSESLVHPVSEEKVYITERTQRPNFFDMVTSNRIKRAASKDDVAENSWLNNLSPQPRPKMPITKKRFGMLYNMIQNLESTVEMNQEQIKLMADEIINLYENTAVRVSNQNKKKGTSQGLNSKGTKENALKYFRRITDSQTIFGAVLSYAGTARIKDIRKVTGVFPGLVCLSMPRYSASPSEWKSFIKEVISSWNNSHFVRIFWDGWSPLTLMTNFRETGDPADVERRWNDLTKNGGDLNKEWKKQLDLIAPYFQQLQMAGVVPILDIVPYVNYKAYIWAGRPGVNGTMKLYKLTHDYLTKKHNLTSIIWTWSLHSRNMQQFEKYWPGSDYVDVASVYMGSNDHLPFSVYERLLNVVGDKPMSMEFMFRVPAPELLNDQPQWTWFTARDEYLDDKSYNDNKRIAAIFNSFNVISTAPSSVNEFFNVRY